MKSQDRTATTPDFDPLAPVADPDLAAFRQQQQAQAAESRRLTLATFGTAAGREWLARKRAHFVEAASYQPGDAPALVAWREGRRSMILEILQEIETARSEGSAA